MQIFLKNISLKLSPLTPSHIHEERSDYIRPGEPGKFSGTLKEH